MRYFGRYHNDCLALQTSLLEKPELLLFLNSIDSNLKFTTIEVGRNELFFRFKVNFKR